MAFEYVSGTLSAISDQSPTPLTEVLRGRREPVYYYNWANVLKRIVWYQAAFSGSQATVCYALKANSHIGLLKKMSASGLGADVVSGGELERALASGFDPKSIVFSGVGKTEEEISLSLRSRICQINVESLPELLRIGRVASGLGAIANIALRLNPDVTGSTHQYVTTGGKENKFGLDMSQVPEALTVFREFPKNLRFQGLAVHIGSQMLTVDPAVRAVERLVDLFHRLRADGWAPTTLDIGGGLGIDYSTNDEDGDYRRLSDYAKGVGSALKGAEVKLLMEPGRFLVARAGVLLTRVEYVKKTPHQTFVIVNSGINHLLRPALYQAVHRIVPITEDSRRPRIQCDIVGPICESSDILGSGRDIEEPREGEWLAVLDTGAYGYTMANRYNLRPLPEEILNG